MNERDVIEKCATVADEWLTLLAKNPPQYVSAQRWVSDVVRAVVRDIAAQIRTLANTPETEPTGAGVRTGSELDRWEDLRKTIAQIDGLDVETWPEHGNAPLAIAASYQLLRNRAVGAEARLAYLANEI